jgi:hypothetical protein
VDQRNFFFVPHVLAVDAGQEVEFLNGDVANHGVTATSLVPENCFNVSIPLAGQRHKHRFLASTYPVAIGCPIHASMAAWIYVFAHPYHGVTDEEGRFRLPPVPPGRYTLQIRHSDGGMKKQETIEVRPGETVRLRVEFHGADLSARDGSSSRGGEKRPRAKPSPSPIALAPSPSATSTAALRRSTPCWTASVPAPRTPSSPSAITSTGGRTAGASSTGSSTWGAAVAWFLYGTTTR